MQTVAVLDFETTGLSPNLGDRATEIAVILLRDGQIVDRYQSLMNAGRRIPSDVVALTGITNDMIASAPPAAKVMKEAAAFVGKHAVVAHNAGFDKRFWQAELGRLDVSAEHAFACTMLVARRIYPDARSHRLSSLAEMLQLPKSGRAHRAMVDAEMAGHLWCRLQHDIARTYGLDRIDHTLMTQVQATSKAKVPTYLRSLGRSRG
ncbi:3'-5' exonuclease [Burkholderia pseudomultivorans]|uniref:DNA polymerase III subunit epsilon n=1 Tax=Burkholderia pseudomultivorans TaxID=1207504 RepID=A0A132ESQ1_9BURK|nr:3'-5' exonuclease [Burkholderia pseudomultivorans]EGD06199.1 DNA polymerase III, epsilon subunit [Burkholderia sp. TJI49]AOI92609.1 DNA polymerase III subunit epsilon [Burkholderia pseudomultivorans]KVC35608.1 DNA polymerase III subunit epsilon [Burkholderia pseudomultivorans]KVC38582.1 DNA polymerase III subunit epsilon [Burkholderia pseudomultivorans]KVC52525.1 DNA polymerase III subunit epsilon [Burkholderia pseudomultivorans]